ncbi:MAG: GntR family transcriptional regulator [Eubacteriales bacterium]
MLLSVDFENEMPIYMQIYEQIVLAISNGNLVPGEALPSVRSLSADIGVNIHTVNKSYAILRDEGYLKMSHRSGATVSMTMPDKSLIIPSIEDRLRQLSAQAAAHGIGQQEFVRMAENAFIEASRKS